MLIQTFQSDLAVYKDPGETLWRLLGLLFDGTMYYIPHGSYGPYLEGWDVFVWRFLADGTFVDEVHFNASLTDDLFIGNGVRSRNGKMYLANDWATWGVLRHFNPVTCSLDGDGDISAGGGLGDLNFFTYPCVDEVQDRLVDQVYGETRKLGVWKLSTREKLYEVTLPDDLVATSLQDEFRMWILMASHVLVLFDYVHLSVLGAVRLPISDSATGVKIAWDFTHSRLMYTAMVPDVGGVCQESIKGFRTIPVATRLSTPIPVQIPRKGGSVQVMVNLLGDMNEPVGGGLIDATITGEGSLLGIPFTDAYGRNFVKVQCNEAGDVPIGCAATIPDYIDV
jgi:hypothetical protein